MNLLKRLNNLWKLSVYTPDDTPTTTIQGVERMLLKKDTPIEPINRPAQIIKRTTPIQEFLENIDK